MVSMPVTASNFENCLMYEFQMGSAAFFSVLLIAFHALGNIGLSTYLICLQGTAQCCVTGPAFEHMLQQADASVVETVMTNVAVFSRMRSQQKGQVMDLLGSRGLFQTLGGQERYIPVSTGLLYITRTQP